MNAEIALLYTFFYTLVFDFLVAPIGYWGICWLTGIKFEFRKMLLVMAPLAVLFAALTSYTSLFLTGYTFDLAMIALSYFSTLAHMFGIYLLYRSKLSTLFIATSIITFIAEFITTAFDPIVRYVMSLNLTPIFQLISSLVFNFLGVPLLFFLVIFLLKKIHFDKLLRSYLNGVNTKKILIVLCIIFPALKNKTNLVNQFWPINFLNSSALWAIILLVVQLGVIYYLSAKNRNEQKIKGLQATVLQQELYVQELENIQQNMRIFRHNYKNMLAGIYLQAQEGQLEAVSNFVHEAVLDFDLRIDRNLRQKEQLSNIKILELKSLFFTKLALIEQKGILLSFEVLHPLEKVAMGITDLLTCLGILIDNSIEAAEKTDRPALSILVSSQPSCVSFIIRNSISEKVDCKKIYEVGYSTKGDQRGLGLFSYQQLLKEYPQVLTATRCSDEEFVQEFKIMDV